MSTLTTLPIDSIVPSPTNPRTGDLEGIKELAASILAQGLLQPIVVRLLPHPPGVYEIVAGHRRFAAMQLLEWQEVQAIITTAENTVELALTENVMRQAMHPIDEFVAFAKLTTEGLKPKQIAKRFGRTEKEIKQALALGRMIPELRTRWKAGAFGYREAKLLCQATEDQQHDIEAKVDGPIDEWHIKRYLQKDRVLPTDRRLKFVGLDTYKKAGGKIERDLFGQEEWLSDPDLLRELEQAKMDQLVADAEAEGWKNIWFIEDPNAPKYTTHDQVHGAESLEPEERGEIELVMGISYDGTPTRALFRVKQKRAEPTKAEDKPGASVMADPDLTKALSEDMSRVMTGFAHAYGQQPSNHHTVLAMLAHVLTNPMQGFPLKIRPEVYAPALPEGQIIAACWPNFSENDLTLEGLLATDESDLVHLIVQAAARCFDMRDGCSQVHRKEWFKLLALTSDALPEWEPTADNYFKRLSRDQIWAAMKEMNPKDVGSYTGVKKSELAMVAERWAAKTGWLPELVNPRLHADLNPNVGETPDEGASPLEVVGAQSAAFPHEKVIDMPPIPDFLRRMAAE